MTTGGQKTTPFKARMLAVFCIGGAGWLFAVGKVAAQTTPAPPKTSGSDTAVSGSVRVRGENWHWFETADFDDRYSFAGVLARVAVSRSSPRLDGQLELAAPLLLGLPANAVAPAPRGQLGLGASYRAGSGGNNAGTFPKQAFLRFKMRAGTNSLRVGRFEFGDGSETTPVDATLAALKRDRINQRLLGTFGFTHVGRSFDGAQFLMAQPAHGRGGVLNLMAMRPTEGVFQVNGWVQVNNVDVVYAAYTRPLPLPNTEARVFAIGYRDNRQAPLSVKVDNRVVALRTGDRRAINIATLGGHYIGAFSTRTGTADVLAWGAAQSGDWGTLRHRAAAFALEAGYQPRGMKSKPWLRGGYFRSSGDKNAADNKHETFFPLLPTTRTYARTPFFNEMNNEDIFASLLFRPMARLNVRADAHKLRLSQSADLWYSGGGAFQNNSFGYAGRPSGGGSRDLATLLDASLDYAFSPQSSAGLYLGHAVGQGRAIPSIYTGKTLDFAYLEITQKF